MLIGWHKTRLLKTLIMSEIICLLVISVLGQSTVTVRSQETSAGKWKLTVSSDAIPLISLQAEDAPLSEIVKSLKEKMEIPIVLDLKMQRTRVTTRFSDALLESALQELAPQGHIDYVIRGGWDTKPSIVGVYLQDRLAAPPSVSASIQPHNEGFSFAGSTDTANDLPRSPASAEAMKPLEISRKQDLLHIRAEQQPLTVVLNKLATIYPVSLELRYESPAIITIDCQGVTLLEALKFMPAEVQLYYRLDLQKATVKPLRILLVKSETKE